MRCRDDRAAGADPAFDAGLDVVNRGVAGLLREELADGLGPVAGAADDDDRLVRLGEGFDLFEPAGGVGTASFVEEGEQFAAADDAGFFPFRLQADVDDGDAALAQFVELGVVDVDDFGMGEAGGGDQAG